ncbi:nucleotidyltransferase domain-containing protein [Lysobacter capsici]|uniref:nucleotidyltransferase domain-containing protein n=1 Tax=Lysobacter capsici TaxID=435897 RepID=UPI000BBAF6D7|nr:nucleotidyltransferase [Lysobacter capsici]ATE72052.1 nucleotidyltransferase [Lysobacter capsici]
MTTQYPMSKRVVAALDARNESRQWEALITNLLKRLELDPKERAMAEADYEQLANQLAAKLSIPRHDVHIFPQGSMRTQTTISQRYPTNFDLDLVVKLSGPKYAQAEPETMFAAFGKALEGNESETGDPSAKRRCWRLPYPGKAYYFDLTPAVPDRTGYWGSSLSVRDPDTRWAPSNPEEFALWFCLHAEKRFSFTRIAQDRQIEAKTTVTPLPNENVGIDDILRRTVQLMKLHRDSLYREESDARKEAMPISVILVTLAAHAYADLHAKRRTEFSSPIEVVLALVEAMPSYIQRAGAGWSVTNPQLPGENFADKWNSDRGLRAAEFHRWHTRLETDLEALLHQKARAVTADQIRSVFGSVGVEAWQASKPANNVFEGLISSAAGVPGRNPAQPVQAGSSNTLG